MSSSNNNKKEDKSAQAEKQPKGKQKADENQLSEEDEKKKQELELIVQRLQDTKPGVQKLALETLRAELRSTSSSVTSIPKPLRFMGAHYDTLKSIFETMEKGESKTLLADILSVLAMTWSKDSTREGLRFKLEGSDEFTEWGHEYLRFLSGEIAQEYQSRYEQKEELTEEDVSDILKIADKIIPLMIKANSEPDACDLLLEIERLDNIVQYCDNNNYSRVCLYLQSASKYFLEPENIQILQVVYKILRKLDKFPEALRIAVMMNDNASIQNTFTSCTDLVVKKQMSFMLARHNIKLGEENPEEISEDLTEEDLEHQSIMGNKRLGEHFLYLAKELDSLDPKTPEDIYKSHLTETRSTLAQNIDSARQNLASTFVNAFVNAGFGNDKLLKQEGTKWIFKNKDSGMLSATASLGMLYLWNVDEGLSEADKYQHSGENYIKAGALLAFGIINCGVRDMDAAYALLSEHVMGNNRDIRLGAILGLGIAYAGSSRSTVNELLMPILADSDQPIEIVAFTALALGMVFVGTCNEDISGTIIQVLMERDEKTLTSTVTRFLVLALGLLFLGKQETAEATIETCKTLNEKIAKYAGMVVETCAYAGTGNVLKIQQLLKTCGEHIEEGKENKHQAVAVLGIALIAMGEELGSEMAVRSYDHLLQYGDAVVKRAVPLAIGLLNISNPKMTLMDTLSKLSHDADSEIAQSAILALGLIGAGTNNARIAQLLRQLSSFYAKEPNTLFMVRIAQGILFAAKGLVTMSPYYSDRSIMQPVVVAGLLTVLHASLDIKNTLLGHYHYLLYFLSCAMRPRMLVTLDESLNPLPVSVRVGTAVDTVAQAGRPKTITGFQTHNTPVLLQYEDRAELATEEYIPVSSVLEDVVILRKNPEYRE